MNSPGATIASAVRIRRAVAADCDALMAFYREHHAHRSRLHDATVWEWEFLTQPSGDQGIPFFILESDGKIVGGIGYVATGVQIGARTDRALFPVNFFINPAFRGLPALRLLRAVLEERAVALGAYVSPDALRLTLKSGFVDMSAHLRTYHYSLRATANPRSMFALTARRASQILRRIVTHATFPDLRHRVTAALDKDWIAGSWPNSALHCLHKTYEWLHWRYASSPLLNTSQFRVQFVYQFRAGKPAAVAIIASDTQREELAILDVMWRGGAVLSALVDKITMIGRAAGCVRVVTHALSEPLDAALRTCLFTSAKSDLGFIVFARDQDTRAALTEPGRWHFMLGDCDAY